MHKKLLIIVLSSILFVSCVSPSPPPQTPYAHQTFPPQTLSKHFLYETNNTTLMTLTTAFTDDYITTAHDTRTIDEENYIIKGRFFRKEYLWFTREDNKNILFRPIYEYSIQIKAQSLFIDIVFASYMIAMNEEVWITDYNSKEQAEPFRLFNEYGLALLNSAIRDDQRAFIQMLNTKILLEL